MKESIKELREKFMKIKAVPFHKSLRRGTTGIGYTFETLLNKKEDFSFLPDYKGIEIKTKLGYSTSPLTLFSLGPKKEGENSYAIYLLKQFGYLGRNNHALKRFISDIYSNKLVRIRGNLLWTTRLDLTHNKLKIVILNYDLKVVDDTWEWDLDDVRERLYSKLNYLAFVKAYPYNINGELYYKYVSMKFYKLKSFDKFLELFEKDIIYISFNMNIDSNVEFDLKNIHDHGVAFKLCIKNLEDLFERINY